MKLVALFLFCFSIPFLSAASNNLSGVCLTVLEEIEHFFYNSEIVSTVGDCENLFGLMSYTEDLRKTFFDHCDKTKPELYEIAFEKFENALRSTGEFENLYSQRIYAIFQDFIMRKSPIFGEAEELSKNVTDADNYGLIRMSSLGSVGSVDMNSLSNLSFDFDESNDFNAFSRDAPTILNDPYSLPSFVSKREAPLIDDQSTKRFHDAELDAKKWTMAVSKLSRFHMKIYIFVKGLSDRSLSSKFFAGTIINDNLKIVFTEYADIKAPFFERSIADHFSVEVKKFVKTLDVQDQNIIDLFIASIMEIGNEIYKEIKEEVKDIDEDVETYVQDFKRKKMERPASPISSSSTSFEHDPLDLLQQNVDDNFTIEDEQFGIPSSNSNTYNSYYKEGNDEKNDVEEYISIPTPEELEQPEIVAFLQDPFDKLQQAFSTCELREFDGIRSIYYSVVDRDFGGIGDEGRVLLGTVLDRALNRIFKRK
jgi:hypothetical protein